MRIILFSYVHYLNIGLNVEKEQNILNRLITADVLY